MPSSREKLRFDILASGQVSEGINDLKHAVGHDEDVDGVLDALVRHDSVERRVPVKHRVHSVTFDVLLVLSDLLVEGSLGDAAEASLSESLVLSNYVEGEIIPASDRLVPLNHNSPEYSEIQDALAAAVDEVTNLQTNELSADEKASAVASLKSAAELWNAYQLKAIQVRVGVRMAIENVQAATGLTFQTIAGSLLLDAIKTFLKHCVGLDF